MTQSIQVTVHVLKSRQQAGPFSKHRASMAAASQRKTGSHCGRRELLCNGISQHGQTQTSVSLNKAWKQGLHWGGRGLTEQSQWRKGMHMTWLGWCGPTGDRSYINTPLHQHRHGREVTCPTWPLTPPPLPLFATWTTIINQGSLWEMLKFVWLGGADH